jgi:hypothetical protein
LINCCEKYAMPLLSPVPCDLRRFRQAMQANYSPARGGIE